MISIDKPPPSPITSPLATTPHRTSIARSLAAFRLKRKPTATHESALAQDPDAGNYKLLIIMIFEEVEIQANLPLQMALYFNCFYSIIWGLITISLWIYKVREN